MLDPRGGGGGLRISQPWRDCPQSFMLQQRRVAFFVVSVEMQDAAFALAQAMCVEGREQVASCRIGAAV